MTPDTLAAQVIDYQKTMFDNTFAVMVSLQDQGEKMMDMALSRTPMLPENSKKACTHWVDLFKKNRDSCKTLMDEGFTRMQQLYQSASAPAEKTADATEKPAASSARADTKKTAVKQ